MSVCYRGEEHCEEVNGGLSDVAAFDGHHDGRQEGQVTEREQQSCRQLATERLSCRIISAAPTTPAYTPNKYRTELISKLQERIQCYLSTVKDRLVI